ncbi:hypothetical protein Lalb_Chr08g0244341 [Lupinus albus]|uniref:Uncharacterized protein n=1 Tax=Lupinus albus TaxID=3870 RepID=A0A6A4Q6N3_LUPAL|nr:hypothetical protein Lalb_Chr08g0244341 [Lupinus albus]
MKNNEKGYEPWSEPEFQVVYYHGGVEMPYLEEKLQENTLGSAAAPKPSSGSGGFSSDEVLAESISKQVMRLSCGLHSREESPQGTFRSNKVSVSPSFISSCSSPD